MTIWFSSDPHFHHANIIKYSNRPFRDVAEMNNCIIDAHNSRVKTSDHWYCLGDVTMERDNQGKGLEILASMHGHKRLIMGNHDHYNIKHYVKWFEKVMAMQMIDNIRFTHIPVHPRSMGRAIANVHGHIHNQPNYEPLIWMKDDGRVFCKPYVNISLEATNYAPVSLEEVKDLIKKAIDATPESSRL